MCNMSYAAGIQMTHVQKTPFSGADFGGLSHWASFYVVMGKYSTFQVL